MSEIIVCIFTFSYIPMQDVAPSAVSMADATEAIICTTHFNVSFFVIRVSFFILARITRIITAFYSAVSLKESRVNPCLKMVKVTDSIFLARKWKAQLPGLAPKYSRERLYFGA